MLRHYCKRVFFTFLIVFSCSTFFAPRVFSEEGVDELKGNLNDLQDEEQDLVEKLNDTTEKKNTLSSQLQYIESTVGKTVNEIQEVEGDIQSQEKKLTKLASDISLYELKLLEIQEEVDKKVVNLKNRIKDSILFKNLSPIEMALSSDSLGDMAKQMEYLERLERKDYQSYIELKDVQMAYARGQEKLHSHKNRASEAKEELGEKQVELAQKKETLVEQKSSKQTLLEITKQDEKEYQNQLNKIRAEQAGIQASINRIIGVVSGGGVPEGTKVSRGDFIGVQGSTGLSTGDHVHFGYYEKCGDDWCDQDPSPGLRSGKLSAPLDDYEITQEYGSTEWAQSSGFYENQFHNALDMAGPIGSSVLAAHDGIVQYSTDGYGGYGALVYDESGEFMTIYWHLRN